jgi:hypothetical protein
MNLLLSRRTLILAANTPKYTKPNVKLQPQQLPPMAVHSIILGNMFDEFVKIYPHKSQWSYNQKAYVLKLLETYDLAVAQIEDEDLKDWFISQLQYPFEIKNGIDS